MEFKEDIQVELKEFFVQPIRELKESKEAKEAKDAKESTDMVDFEEAIISGRMYPNTLILNSLQHNLIKYIGKYLSGWNHEDLTLSEGEIYFGVRDDGKISGIPYVGDLKTETIYEMILNCAPFIKCEKKGMVLESVGIEIIPIKPFRSNIIKEYFRQLEIYHHSINKHKQSVKKYVEWHNKSREWHCKLVDYLNVKTKRDVFLKWVIDNCDSESKDTIINEIKEWTLIDKFTIRINEHKKNKNSMVYWLCIFKDLMTSKTRPKPTISKIYTIQWKKIYYSPYWMNYHISTMNPKVKFYLVKLTIPNLKIPIYAEYNGDWIRYKRVEGKFGPSSIPLF